MNDAGSNTKFLPDSQDAHALRSEFADAIFDIFWGPAPPEDLPACLCACEAGVYALADHAAFKFSNTPHIWNMARPEGVLVSGPAGAGRDRSRWTETRSGRRRGPEGCGLADLPTMQRSCRTCGASHPSGGDRSRDGDLGLWLPRCQRPHRRQRRSIRSGGQSLKFAALVLRRLAVRADIKRYSFHRLLLSWLPGRRIPPVSIRKTSVWRMPRLEGPRSRKCGP